ncbi:hypothetical protein QYF50_23730 [Paenibacillus vini]|uniref:hypothetical protein n=1 Tax=Paenibacillus vini TaxID=1476024 RepID=UPI0025B64786|nr:hypothetical protein [Paenibacillus vini]MDN4070907.1 hypothetical protein [Paenibacillus vini]
MEQNNQVKIYLLLNKDIAIKFKCTEEAEEELLSRGEHYTIIDEYYGLIDNEFYLRKLNKGMCLPRAPLPIEEVRRLYQKSTSDNNNDVLIRGIYRIQDELIQYQSEVNFLKTEKLRLEEHIKNSRPTYKKMQRKNITNSDRGVYVCIIRTIDNQYKIGKTINLASYDGENRFLRQSTRRQNAFDRCA